MATTKTTSDSVDYQAFSTAVDVGEKPIEPLFNAAFIRIFGEEESKELTRGLVNAMLQRAGIDPIDEITQIDAEYTAVAGSINCKTPRMDVRIVAERRLIDLEAQTYPDDIEKRSLFYGAQLLVSETERGTKYDELPQVVVITLLDGRQRFPRSENFVSVSKMSWSSGDGHELDDSDDGLVYVLVELSKIRARYNGSMPSTFSDEAEAWAYLLTSGYMNAQEVKSIVAKFPTIEEFAQRYGFAIGDPKVKRAYEDALSAELEYDSRQRYYARLEREASEKGMKEGLEKGLEEGLKQGLKQGIEQGLEQGIEQGIEQGLEQGLEQGWSQGVEQLAMKLREMGIDESLIEQAVSDVKRVD